MEGCSPKERNQMSRMVAEANVISVWGSTKYYDGFPAVNGIDFEVKDGEVFGFLGSNEIILAKREFGIVPEASNLYDELTVLFA